MKNYPFYKDKTDIFRKLKDGECMQTLEILYENPPKSRAFLPRKKSITTKKTILYGPRFSGKSSIVIDHISNYKKERCLYIDFSDMRVSSKEIGENIQEFIDKKNIELLVLEHFDNQFKIPKAEEIVLTSTKPLNVKEFNSEIIYPLDFEEFISFERKNLNIENSFNNFANIGTYPSIVLRTQEEKYRNLQLLLNAYFFAPSAIEILQTLSNYQSSKTSILKIYSHLKQNIKLSKDLLYTQIDNFLDESLLFFLEKFDQPKVSKKFYFIDFALKNALTFQKDFLKKFENIIFSELIKKEWKFFYTEHIDFYVPDKNLAIVSIPFLPAELIKRKFLKIKNELLALNIKELQIISVGNEGGFLQNGINCEIIPFWQWATR